MSTKSKRTFGGLLTLLLLGNLSLSLFNFKSLRENRPSNTTPSENLAPWKSESRSELPSPSKSKNADSKIRSSFQEGERENIEIYRDLNPSVVNISTEVLAYNWFLEPVPQSGSTGSGSIIDTEGYVLTNSHVVKEAYKVFINLANGTEFEGEVIGTDLENDLAIVRFDPAGTPLTAIPFGSSEELEVGQKVLAIGNPFGLDRTLTTGIISAVGRLLKSESGLIFDDMIQTDASINPGNSGGPLIDSQGRMIGINTLIYSPTKASIGIGFAVPIETAKRIIPDLIEYGSVDRGWLDIEIFTIVPALVRYANLPTSRGILVSQVKRGSTAERGGLRGGSEERVLNLHDSLLYLGGDIITAINKREVSDLGSYYRALENTKSGEIAEITVVRRNGEKEILQVELSSRKRKKA